MSDEDRVSRRDLFGLGLSRVRERFDEEIPGALAAQERRAATRPSEPAWAAWDVPPPEGSERFTRAAAEGLVEASGVKEGERVLDWGCGQGEVALAAARLGAEVTAVDFAAGPLERAWDLAEDEELEIEWLEQDGLDLILGNSWFDRSLSGFGAIWSHDLPGAVREIFRVTRPGGTVGFTTWTDLGFYGSLLRLGREHRLLPGGPSPSAWSRDERLRQDIEPYSVQLHVASRSLELDIAADDTLWDFVAQSAAPLARGVAELPAERRTSVEAEVAGLAREESDDSGVVLARYLEVVAEVPAV